MNREKPITIVPVFNTGLKPVLNDEGEEMFPIYARVVYNSKNTHLPITLLDTLEAHAFYVTEQKFEKLKEDIEEYTYKVKSKKGVDWRAVYIYRFFEELSSIVEYELNIKKEQFALRGLGKRVDFLFTSTLDLFGNQLNENIKSYFTSSNVFCDYHYHILLERSFVQNYDQIFPFLQAKEISLPEEIVLSIELYFLIAAAKNHIRGFSYYDLLIGNCIDEFDCFLSNESIFSLDQTLKIPLENFFSRYVSLNPPSKDKSFYINELEQALEFVNKEYLKLIA